jgi:hypothetical protein
MVGYGNASANPRSEQIAIGVRPNTMENLTKSRVLRIETEVGDIISELNTALSFLREADETSDKQRQRHLIRYAQITHHAVLRLLPSMPLAGLDETRITLRLLQIRASLKRHGICVPRTWQEMAISQRNETEKGVFLH